jgi:hypothetical protein
MAVIDASLEGWRVPHFLTDGARTLELEGCIEPFHKRSREKKSPEKLTGFWFSPILPHRHRADSLQEKPLNAVDLGPGQSI